MAAKWRTAIKGVLDRDRPIFLQVRGGGWIEKCLWYVIEVEEKEVDTRNSSSVGQGNSPESSSSSTTMRNWIRRRLGDFGMRMGFCMAGEPLRSGNEDDTTSLMVRDKVRRLPVPATKFSYTRGSNLVVFNSCLYLIGSDEEEGGIRCFDLSSAGGNNKGWQPTPPQTTITPLAICTQIRSIAREDGWVCSMGRFGSNFLVHPSTGRREKLPEIPVRHACPFLLGFSNKHIIVQSSWRTQLFMHCYDLESGKWEELEKPSEQTLCEILSPGVVLYNGRYLFCYGKFNPTTTNEGTEFQPYHLDEKKKKNRWILKESYKDFDTRGIYVFDIEQRKWLSNKVEGLPNDGKALPLPPEPPIYQQEDDNNATIETPYLLQIGVNNKLALVWKNKNKVRWSKFIIHPHSPPAVSDDEPPCFRAQLLSKGGRKFAQHELWSCAQGL